jgi:hypothetical protein
MVLPSPKVKVSFAAYRFISVVRCQAGCPCCFPCLVRCGLLLLAPVLYSHSRKPGDPADRVPRGVRFLVSRCCYPINGLLRPDHTPQSPEHVVFIAPLRRVTFCRLLFCSVFFLS